MDNIILVVLTIFGTYFLFYSLYWLVLVLTSLVPFRPRRAVTAEVPEMLLVLPAYKPGEVFFKVLDSVSRAVAGKRIKVLVLLQEPDDDRFASRATALGFEVRNRKFSHIPGNSYQHALRYIASVIRRGIRAGMWNPEFVMLVDKDNLINKEYFDVIPSNFYEQYDVIQGQRKSLSSESGIAFFDHISETLNDAMFRSGKMPIGGAVEISGSGMLIETALFVQMIKKLDPNAPGFDKNLMSLMLANPRDIRTVFWPASFLEEEKTADLAVHGQQRIRWFGEQYYNAIHQAWPLLKAFVRYRRWAAFDYIITLWRPPRSIQLLIAPVMAILEWVFYLLSGTWFAGFPVFTVSFGALCLAVFIFLSGTGQLREALRFALLIPRLVWVNFSSARRSLQKKNLGKFIHTEHRI
ncbi:MAG: glycosyltransferase family 2 protein [Cyclobacteriaceae bacterium]|nr:glycosyltransferase family 2 protein [Cyclobacteriaceae bacterium]